jgi:hypothetical protein
MLARNVLGHLRRTIDGELVSNLFDPPGRKLGWAHHEERAIIREHLNRKLGRLEVHSWDWFRREQRITAIQRRLHRYDLTFRELGVLYKRKWAREAPPSTQFTTEELRHLVELFTGANDPLSQSIAEKAAARLLSVQKAPLGEQMGQA